VCASTLEILTQLTTKRPTVRWGDRDASVARRRIVRKPRDPVSYVAYQLPRSLDTDVDLAKEQGYNSASQCAVDGPHPALYSQLTNRAWQDGGRCVEGSHRHLFTPNEWCLIPYMARFGLTEVDIRKASGGVRGYLFDQYVRACGFDPTDSYALIVRPTGDCEFTPLEASESRWCCENAQQISATIGPPTATTPPWDAERTWSCPSDSHSRKVVAEGKRGGSS